MSQVTLSKLIEEFRRHTEELTDADDIDTALQTIIVDIDQKLGQIERTVSTFRITFNGLIGQE